MEELASLYLNNDNNNRSDDSNCDGVDDCVSGASVTCNMTFETDLFMAKMRSHLSLNTRSCAPETTEMVLGVGFCIDLIKLKIRWQTLV